MNLNQNQEVYDQIGSLKNSDLYHQFSGLELEIKRLYLKLFEENIQETVKKIQVENEEEIVKTYFDYLNEQYENYMKDLELQNQDEYQIEYSFINNIDDLKDNINVTNYESSLSDNNSKVVKIINKGDLDLYEKQNLFKEFIQTDIITLNNKPIMGLRLFKIITYQEDKEIILERFSYYLKFRHQKNNFKYNQNISEPEKIILSTPNLMLNSNIIDGYINYLQIQDEINYFSLPSNRRQYYQRLLLFPSSLITNCTLKSQYLKGHDYIQKKYLCIFLDHIQQFRAIQYKFWLVYQKIGIVVNISNFHWLFLEIKVHERVLVLYDSLFKSSTVLLEVFFNFIFRTLTQDENFTFKLEIKQDFPLQKDGTSCGYFTCIAANYLSQIQNDQGGFYKILPRMKQELMEIFFKKNKN